jgi:integrase
VTVKKSTHAPQPPAKLVKLPPYEAQVVDPWSIEEARRFLDVAQADPLYLGFVLLVLYGLRLGEVMGLRWA